MYGNAEEIQKRAFPSVVTWGDSGPTHATSGRRRGGIRALSDGNFPEMNTPLDGTYMTTHSYKMTLGEGG